VLFGQIPRPRSLRGDVPKDLERVTMKLLERDLPARYATAEDALHDLLACTDSSKAVREALIAVLAERFQTEAPVRQSLLRQRSSGNAMTPPQAVTPFSPTIASGDPVHAAPSLGAVMNAPTGTLERRLPGRGRGMKLVLVGVVTAISAIVAFAIVSAVRSKPAVIADAGSPASTPLPVADAPAPPPPEAAPPDAAPPADAVVAQVPPDAKKDAPPINVAQKKYGKLHVVTYGSICTVYVDGVKKGESPHTFDKLLVGRRTVRLLNTDAGIDHQTSVTIVENQTTELKYP